MHQAIVNGTTSLVHSGGNSRQRRQCLGGELGFACVIITNYALCGRREIRDDGREYAGARGEKFLCQTGVVR